ncbi:MAG: succinylglutamate desuccinylase/aspartoacylase family protein [Saprospiraceae bacterium]|nr:succinylglutamate desuccinylase/aspartoacylase family protein [Saprospiraceae bacterium]
MKITQILSFLLVLLSINNVSSQNQFQAIFNANIRPVKEQMRINFEDSLGNKGHLPVAIIKGKTDGPVFTIVAGVHGYEYPPIVATQAIMQEIDVQKLKGTLVVIPIANLGSFFTRTPFINPQDQKNLNNAFPGKADGSITEQIAHFITTNIIPVSEVFLDIHGGDACEDLIPFVCYYNNTKKPKQTALAKKLSEDSGFEFVVSYPYTISDTDPAKYTFKQAVQDGKTALSIECGKLGNVQEENVNLIKTGVYNMLATMDMYANGSGPHPNIVYRNDQTYIKSAVDGIFYSEFKAGDTVKKDEIVGHTTDEFGKTIEEYKSPKDGVILYMLATPPINVDDTVMCISSLNDDEK